MEGCGKKYQTKVALEAHLKEHERTGPKFKCELCSAGFASKGALTLHQKKKVCQGGNYECEHKDCNMKFVEKEEFEQHIKEAHFGKRGFICDVCGKVLLNKGAFGTHMKSHAVKDAATTKKAAVTTPKTPLESDHSESDDSLYTTSSPQMPSPLPFSKTAVFEKQDPQILRPSTELDEFLMNQKSTRPSLNSNLEEHDEHHDDREASVSLLDSQSIVSGQSGVKSGSHADGRMIDFFEDF